MPPDWLLSRNLKPRKLIPRAFSDFPQKFNSTPENYLPYGSYMYCHTSTLLLSALKCRIQNKSHKINNSQAEYRVNTDINFNNINLATRNHQNSEALCVLLLLVHVSIVILSNVPTQLHSCVALSSLDDAYAESKGHQDSQNLQQQHDKREWFLTCDQLTIIMAPKYSHVGPLWVDMWP